MAPQMRGRVLDVETLSRIMLATSASHCCDRTTANMTCTRYVLSAQYHTKSQGIASHDLEQRRRCSRTCPGRGIIPRNANPTSALTLGSLMCNNSNLNGSQTI